METVIENGQRELPLKYKIFNTKEEYLAMRKAWKDFHNNGCAKAEWVETTHKKYYWRTNHIVEFVNKTKISPLSSYHYMLYNLLRGFESSRGFFSEGAEEGTEGWIMAIRHLRFYIPLALPEEKQLPIFMQKQSKEDQQEYLKRREQRRQEHLEKLVKPFGNTVTEEHLEKVLQLIR